MDTGFIVLFVVMVIASIIAGIRIGIHIGMVRKANDEAKGVLTVCSHDPKSGPELFLTLLVPAEEIKTQKHVLFEVHVMK